MGSIRTTVHSLGSILSALHYLLFPPGLVSGFTSQLFLEVTLEYQPFIDTLQTALPGAPGFPKEQFFFVGSINFLRLKTAVNSNRIYTPSQYRAVNTLPLSTKSIQFILYRNVICVCFGIHTVFAERRSFEYFSSGEEECWLCAEQTASGED